MRSPVFDTQGHLVSIEHSHRAPARLVVLARIARVVDFAFGILYSLLLVRLVLDFFGARPGSGFVEAIRRWTEVFYAPFRGIFPTETTLGGHVAWSIVVAIVAYMLLHALIRGLLRLMAGA